MYKESAKEAKNELAQMKISKSQTPSIKPSSHILTPTGSKPYIKAFCPSTPLKDNYPSKQLSMSTVYQKGNFDQSQIKDLNQKAELYSN